MEGFRVKVRSALRLLAAAVPLMAACPAHTLEVVRILDATGDGVNSLSFPVPAGAVVGTTNGRFRCTTDGAVSFTAAASDGEVEDYQVTIVAGGTPAMELVKTVDSVDNGDV